MELTSLSSSALSERFLFPPRPPLPPRPRPRPLPLTFADPRLDVGVDPTGMAPTSVFSGVPALPPLALLLAVGAGGGVDSLSLVA